MEKGRDISTKRGFWGSLVRGWFAIRHPQVRLLQFTEVAPAGPTVFAVSNPANFLEAVALSTSLERPVHCLLAESLAPMPFARSLARSVGIIFYEDGKSIPESAIRESLNILGDGGALAVFADAQAGGAGAPGAATETVAKLVSRAEAQQAGRRVAVHPVHLFMPDPKTPSQEILIYVDSALARPETQPATASQPTAPSSLAEALESRFRENSFQLRPADLNYFLADLEEVLRADLQEDWATRPEWKQDVDGFVLSRVVTEWVRQTNYLNPARLVALRHSLDEYRRLQKQCALRQLEVEEEASMLDSGWRRALVSLETLLGFPLALYGLINHALTGLALFVAGSFRTGNSRARTTEWTIRAAVTLAFYTLQIILVSHWRGRAAAGYYAPTLPVSGAYLWRYAQLIRPRARSLLISLTIPGLTKKIKRLRFDLTRSIDQALGSCR